MDLLPSCAVASRMFGRVSEVKRWRCTAIDGRARRNGRIVTCGATAGQTIELNLWPFFVKQQRLIGSYGRNRTDLEATFLWASDGKLKPLIDRTVGLSDTVSTLVALRNSQISGKAVVAL